MEQIVICKLRGVGWLLLSSADTLEKVKARLRVINGQLKSKYESQKPLLGDKERNLSPQTWTEKAEAQDEDFIIAVAEDRFLS